MLELFWLLLPVAAWSGWYIGRRDSGRRNRQQAHLSRDYFRGLNYIISEQPDKAIEVFTRMVEVDSETVETHLALGNLFRRRGEVDRAIRIHQNLIARPSLSSDLRAQALLELGVDYMRAGLLDRAESLFEQVVEFGVHVEAALRQLLVIYQQEKEWQKAIDAATRLESRSGAAMQSVVAHFHCELADKAIAQGDRSRTKQLLRRALSNDPNCVRASILTGRLEAGQQNYRGALKAYQRVKHQDIDYLPEVLAPIRDCYHQLGQTPNMVRYLKDLLDEYPGPAPMLMLADLLQEQQGEREAIEFVATEVRRRPTVLGLHRLIELTAAGADTKESAGRQILEDAFAEVLRDRPGYECKQCGFTAKSLYWQCPSCKSWSTVKPTHALKGD
ncbi:lipopolysaccharide assembly protein LapB [Alkalilimnicola ehrlichii]|uniref:Lipopolysaccharide assembly protein B n=1 Tax=Alkalilimnicola ehrlichii TaxID=351052 RepID=A0A3E0WN13_9GAMM|nr:lipopolysaccharide assembly protein LapB [Alkalilimnicola ehrlichii]RFA27763.1 lipopolysaccharide assembly protein LapB [Alkalilimnicola ehrlichii]RFA33593.1 lipopolysaccharide assembly protein LapB [Alkalilimnicola ehrlichii]